MAYKLSDRKKINQKEYKKKMLHRSSLRRSSNGRYPDTRKLKNNAKTFFIFGILSILTAFIFGINIDEPVAQERITAQEKNANNGFTIVPGLEGLTPSVTQAMPEAEEVLIPLTVARNKTTYEIEIKAHNMPTNSWTIASGELLDSNKEYLFSFSQEMWIETGRDSEGPWKETEDDYSMKITIPKAGKYYLSFDIEGKHKSPQINVKVTRQLGSTIPHFWLGIFLIIIGLILNQRSNKA